MKIFGQNKSENIVYIVDKITILEDPEKRKQVVESADMNNQKQRQFKTLGFENLTVQFIIYTTGI
jgi:hypothetical protein